MSPAKWCVYSHAANGQIFYVGAGSPRRPYDRFNRSSQWREHVNRVGKHEIQIHLWTDDRAEAQKMEAALIRTGAPCCNLVGIKPPKCPPIGIRMPRFILAALEKLAQADDRTVSYMINKILAEYLRARKLLK
jgi:hypothetical protein